MRGHFPPAGDVSRVRGRVRCPRRRRMPPPGRMRTRPRGMSPSVGRVTTERTARPGSATSWPTPSPDRAQRSLDDPFSGRGGRLLLPALAELPGPGGLGLGGVVDPVRHGFLNMALGVSVELLELT